MVDSGVIETRVGLGLEGKGDETFSAGFRI